MKKFIQNSNQKVKAGVAMAMTLVAFNSSTALAALPDTADPSNAAADGDYIGLLKGYGYDIAIVIGLFLATIAFIVVAKNVVGIYSEIGQGKKTWGDMGMHGGMGVLLLVFVVYLLTEAAAIIF